MLPILAIIVLIVYFLWRRQKDLTEMPYVEGAKVHLCDSLPTVGVLMVVVALAAYVIAR